MLKRKMAGDVAVFQHPSIAATQDEEPIELSWVEQRAIDLRLKTMAHLPQTPYWNTTMVTAWVAVLVGMFTILGAIAGLYLYTDHAAELRGIEKGRQQAEQQQILERLNKAEADAAEAKKFSIYATAGADEAAGHKPNQKEKK